jgi:hypothetical protein
MCQYPVKNIKLFLIFLMYRVKLIYYVLRDLEGNPVKPPLSFPVLIQILRLPGKPELGLGR